MSFVQCRGSYQQAPLDLMDNINHQSFFLLLWCWRPSPSSCAHQINPIFLTTPTPTTTSHPLVLVGCCCYVARGCQIIIVIIALPPLCWWSCSCHLCLLWCGLYDCYCYCLCCCRSSWSWLQELQPTKHSWNPPSLLSCCSSSLPSLMADCFVKRAGSNCCWHSYYLL